MSMVISSAVTKGLLILALLFWAVCATLWLQNLSTKEDCSLVLARSLRSALVGEQAVTTEEGITTEPSDVLRPTNGTLETREEEFDRIIKQYWSQIDQPRHDEQQNCTLVMQTYKREKILSKVLMHYCSIPLLQKILVIWNDVETAVPEALKNLTQSCGTELIYIVSKENKLTNRYIPRSEIETDCVCLMDDDRIIDSDDMKFGFEVWKTFRQRIVGFEERSFVKSPQGKYIYTNYERRRFFNVKIDKMKVQNHLPPGYSIEIKDGIRLLHVKNKTFVLGKVAENSSAIVRKSHFALSNGTEKSEGYNIMLNSCFLHKTYLEMYHDPLIIPSSLVEYVNRQMNCEDILMSVVVTKFLKDIGRPQSGVLAVKSNWIGNLEDEAREQGKSGLSARADHYLTRSACLEKFAEVYGYLPLRTSKIVMTKVTYHL